MSEAQATDRFARYPSLQGRVVLITGGASGIGAEHGRAFRGARAPASPSSTSTDAGGRGHRRPHRRPVPVLRPARHRRAARRHRRRSREQLGPITVLVNNAARDDRHGLETVEPDYWDERMHTNLRHQFFCAQAVAPMMKEAGGGVDHQHRLGQLDEAAGRHAGLHHRQGRRARPDPRPGARPRPRPASAVNEVVPGWIFTERQVEKWATPDAEAEQLDRQCLKEQLLPAGHRPDGAVAGRRRQPHGDGAELRGRWRCRVALVPLRQHRRGGGSVAESRAGAWGAATMAPPAQVTASAGRRSARPRSTAGSARAAGRCWSRGRWCGRRSRRNCPIARTTL